ncbi:MAG: metallophosphoesterase family protein [Chloroflexi bacterium]|nr:metallophosphoesterase family protein [Chloroflexota bacterium]
MRIGILADVHANVYALEAVLANGKSSVGRWWLIGDALGRGPAPVETLMRLREHVDTRHWLVGNHDLCITGLLPADDLSESEQPEQRVWEDHRRRLKAHRPDGQRPLLWEWCRRTWRLERAKPRLIPTRSADCWLVHAALGGRMFNVGHVPKYSYIFPWQDIEHQVIMDQQFERLLAKREEKRTVVLIHGHTHVPYLAVKPGGGDGHVLGPIHYGQPQRLGQFDAVLINPGSVGQPRNGDRMVHASYGILDTKASTFEFRRVLYDSEPTLLDMAVLDYDPSLIYFLKGNDDGNPLQGKSAIWLEWQRTYREQPWGWEPVSSNE